MSGSNVSYRIAVVGSGIAGLSAAWALNQYPSRYSVTLYEAARYPGGHAQTINVPPLKEHSSDPSVPVNTGFIVCNPSTYPNLVNLLDALDVPLTFSAMSFSVSRDHGNFEWASSNLNSLFSQKRHLLDFSMNGVWIMLWDIVRFNWHALQIADIADGVSLEEYDDDTQNVYEKYSKMSVNSFLQQGNYSDSFINNYLLPQIAAIWSSPTDFCLYEFPVLGLIRFLRNQNMLQLSGRPNWMTIPLGACKYIQSIVDQLPDVRLSRGVKAIWRESAQPSTNNEDPKSFKRNQVTIEDCKGQHEKFDYVILATHGDTALQILQDASEEEADVLKRVKSITNRAVLHRDSRLMPLSKTTWSAWNYLTKSPQTSSAASSDEQSSVCITYWMNRLQPHIPQKTHGDVFLTLNPLIEPDPSLIIGQWSYAQPMYGFDLASAQEQLANITNVRYTGFAGAWTNYGLHEDGCTSGLMAAAALGAAPPFRIYLNGGNPTARRMVPRVRSLGAPLPSNQTYGERLCSVLAYVDLDCDAPSSTVSSIAKAAYMTGAGISRSSSLVKLSALHDSKSNDSTFDIKNAHQTKQKRNVNPFLPKLASGLIGITRNVVEQIRSNGRKSFVVDPVASLHAPRVQSGSTVAVPAMPARSARQAEVPGHVFELFERGAFLFALLTLGLPVVALLWMMNIVRIEQGQSENSSNVELLRIHDNLRITWQGMEASKAHKQHLERPKYVKGRVPLVPTNASAAAAERECGFKTGANSVSVPNKSDVSSKKLPCEPGPSAALVTQHVKEKTLPSVIDREVKQPLHAAANVAQHSVASAAQSVQSYISKLDNLPSASTVASGITGVLEDASSSIMAAQVEDNENASAKARQNDKNMATKAPKPNKIPSVMSGNDSAAAQDSGKQRRQSPSELEQNLSSKAPEPNTIPSVMSGSDIAAEQDTGKQRQSQKSNASPSKNENGNSRQSPNKKDTSKRGHAQQIDGLNFAQDGKLGPGEDDRMFMNLDPDKAELEKLQDNQNDADNLERSRNQQLSENGNNSPRLGKKSPSTSSSIRELQQAKATRKSRSRGASGHVDVESVNGDANKVDNASNEDGPMHKFEKEQGGKKPGSKDAKDSPTKRPIQDQELKSPQRNEKQKRQQPTASGRNADIPSTDSTPKSNQKDAKYRNDVDDRMIQSMLSQLKDDMPSKSGHLLHSEENVHSEDAEALLAGAFLANIDRSLSQGLIDAADISPPKQQNRRARRHNK